MRFAFVTPRYGAEISSGAEHACRLLAEQVSERHDVDVLTTCARDPLTWKNEYAEGADRVRGVLVRHFAVSQPHDRTAFNQFSDRLFTGPRARSEELEWVRRLGPSSPALIEHLKRQHRSYDAILFFSLCHATTVHGMAIAPERSVLFPHLQMDRALRFGLWAEVASSARGVGYLSASERRLARAFLQVAPAVEEVVGIGIDAPPQQAYPRHQQDPADEMPLDDEAGAEADKAAEVDPLTGRGVPFRRRHRLYGPFALYGGRVERDNGCEEMLEYFDTYAAADGDTSLVLMGVKMMKVPEERYLRLAGVLPDRERMIAYEAADVTLAPTPDDLLSQSLLESFAVGTPVLASARNDAAVEHVRRANAGLYYANRDEFAEALRMLMTNTRLREKLGENGRQYVRQNHRWDAVLDRFERLITKVRGRS
ncbi:MAG: glycosyltransferase [Vicinamibacterales bacterium]|nr:glycosyltransferase [Vicinamibacterales bacterium]